MGLSATRNHAGIGRHGAQMRGVCVSAQDAGHGLLRLRDDSNQGWFVFGQYRWIGETKPLGGDPSEFVRGHTQAMNHGSIRNQLHAGASAGVVVMVIAGVVGTVVFLSTIVAMTIVGIMMVMIAAIIHGRRMEVPNMGDADCLARNGHCQKACERAGRQQMFQQGQHEDELSLCGKMVKNHAAAGMES